MPLRTRLEMPLLMTLSMAFGLFFAAMCVILVPAALLGVASVEVDGRAAAPGAERLSVILLIALLGAALGAIGYGFRTERSWTRPLPAILWLVFAVYGVGSAVFGKEDPASMWGLAAEGAAFALFTLWYFYRKRNVVAYYSELERRTQPRGFDAAGV